MLTYYLKESADRNQSIHICSLNELPSMHCERDKILQRPLKLIIQGKFNFKAAGENSPYLNQHQIIHTVVVL